MKRIFSVILGVLTCACACAAADKGASEATSNRVAKITAASTYYDRKEGLAIFTKDVCVEDEEYQLHADKAYVFMKGTNELDRIVAIGHVAMTNGTKRAYGEKASYHRENGLVILYAGEGGVAEVRDESSAQAQSICGQKIKFWIDSEQIEIVGNSTISAPVEASGLKSSLGETFKKPTKNQNNKTKGREK